MIIAFTGKKGSGKSEACKCVVKLLKDVERINIKDTLIREIRLYFPDFIKSLAAEEGMSVDELFETKPPVMRAFMNNFGSDLRMVENKMYWIDQWEMDVDHSGAGYVLVDDARYLSDVERIRQKGGIVIRIERPSVDSKSTHSSETEMDAIDPDYTIVAETKSELFEKIKALLIDVLS